MASREIRCPKCGAPSAKSLKPDLYCCNYCGAEFNIIRPDVVRTDAVSHNCPICGKPIQAGTGYTCSKCKKYDLDADCVDKGPGSVFMCKECLKAEGVACVICGKLGYLVCGSCQKMAERGAMPKNEVIQTCQACHESLFTGTNYNRSGRIPVVEKISFTCPKCGEVCASCALERKERFSSGYFCKNCGAKISTFVVGAF